MNAGRGMGSMGGGGVSGRGAIGGVRVHQAEVLDQH